MTYDIRAELRRQIELEDEQRALGQSRYHSRALPWKAEAGSMDEEANLPPGQHLLKACVGPVAEAIEEFLKEACERKAGRLHRAVDFLLLSDPQEVAYTKELGEFLARHYDANVIRTLILAARAGALFPGDTGGTGLQNAGFANDANALIDGFSAAKQAMDEKDVPVNTMPVHGLLRPAQWYLVARSDKNLNRDVNGGTASVRSMTLTTIDDIQVHKSNIASGVFGADDSGNAAIPAPYRAKFGTTVGAIWTPMAACSAIVQDPSFQIVDQPEKQGTLLISRMMVGTRKLRSKCAVELRTGAVPA